MSAGLYNKKITEVVTIFSSVKLNIEMVGMRGKVESILNLRVIYTVLFHHGVNILRSIQKSLVSFKRNKRGEFHLDLISPRP